MNKRSFASILAIVILFCSFVIPSSAQSNPFSDVSSDSYYFDAVIWALESGITSGTSQTTFSPADTCTRGQVVTFLWRSQGKPEPVSQSNRFSDVFTSDYYFKAVLWAVENNITKGTTDTTFSPNATCTRAQVLTFLWRAEHEPGANGISSLASWYTGQYFEGAVAWADTNNMLSDMGDDVFDAESFCPRSDIVTYLYRYTTGYTPSGIAEYIKLTPSSATVFNVSDIPAYSGSDFVQINGNNPYFSLNNLTTESYELYGELDGFGRCTTCVACIGTDIMPTEKRGSIGQIKPTGWHTVKYDCVNGQYLYNRCHLIGYQLTGENDNVNNLITGTRNFNLNMLDYEDLIAEYVEDSDAHILYRVTPVFYGNDLLAYGVLMEGMSVEDKGKSVKFCVFVYNVQPNIVIDYSTGDSYEDVTEPSSQKDAAGETYVLNKNTRKFHYPSCSSVKKMSEKNKQIYTGTRDEIINMGYDPCAICHP